MLNVFTECGWKRTNQVCVTDELLISVFVPKGQLEQSPGRDTARAASHVAALGIYSVVFRSPNGTALIPYASLIKFQIRRYFRAATSWLSKRYFYKPQGGDDAR